MFLDVVVGQIPYLLCALGDGHLFNFVLDIRTGLLMDRKKISLGTQPITLRTFRSKNATHVFAASDRPTVIYSSNRKLLYSNVNLKEVNHMCPFNSAPFPDRYIPCLCFSTISSMLFFCRENVSDLEQSNCCYVLLCFIWSSQTAVLSTFMCSLAIGKEGALTIGTIDDIQKLHIRTVPLGEHPRRICHQEQSHTFAICSVKYTQNASNEDMETHFVRLIDDQTFEFVASYPLDTYENGCSIITCSFADDPSVYYCVGTAYALPEENEPSKVKISILPVLLITSS